MNALFYKFIAVAHAADPWYNGLNQFVNNQPPTVEKVQFNSSIGLDPYLNALHCTAKMDGSFLGCYIAALYSFFVQGAIVLAVVMIMFGGFQWLLAAGNSSKISEAKSTISAAIFGLILALTSYLLFAQINSKLVELQDLNITQVQPIILPIDTVVQPLESNISGINKTGVNPKQLQDMHPDLLNAFSRLDYTVPKLWSVVLNSVTDDRIYTGNCNRLKNGGVKSGCSHGGEYHYGGPNNLWAFNKDHPPKSCAVDLAIPAAVGINYHQLELKMTESGFTYVQCEETCFGSGSRCNDKLDCATGKDIDNNYNGPTRYGKIGHIHGQIDKCRAINTNSQGASWSYN